MQLTPSPDEQSSIRRENLARLVNLMGGNISEFARVTGRNRRVLTDSLNGKRPIGSRLAQSIEESLNLPIGTMSIENSPVIEKIGAGLSLNRLPLYSLHMYFEQKEMPHFEASNWIAYGGGNVDDLIAVQMSDDSLSPVFEKDDQLVFSKSKTPRAGDYVLCKIVADHVLIVRQFAKPVTNADGVMEFELRPLKDIFPVLTANDRQATILGVCVEFRRRIP